MQVQVIHGTYSVVHNKGGIWRGKRSNSVVYTYESSWARTLEVIGKFDWIYKR